MTYADTAKGGSRTDTPALPHAHELPRLGKWALSLLPAYGQPAAYETHPIRNRPTN